MKIDMSESKEIIGEEAQLAAVGNNGYAIKYTHNPSEEVQLAAVWNNGYAIKYIHNSSEAVQLAAVRQNGHAIQYIHNPSEAVQLASLGNNLDAIQYFKRSWMADRAEELTVEAFTSGEAAEAGEEGTTDA